MTPSEILKRSRDLLRQPGGWTKGALSYRKPRSSECSYCALGALRAASGAPEEPGYAIFKDRRRKNLSKAIQTLLDHLPELDEPTDHDECEEYWDIVAFNDNVAEDVTDVLELFDRAIASLEEEGT